MAKKKIVKKRYLITVEGWLDCMKTPHEVVSVKVKTNDPVKWFLSKPKVYSRTEFVPHALIGFWEIK